MTDEKVIPWHGDEDGVVRGYMWVADFMSELGATPGGNVIYPTESDCRAHPRCEDQAGIVEVEIRFKRIVEKPENLDELVTELRQYRRSWTVHKIPAFSKEKSQEEEAELGPS